MATTSLPSGRAVALTTTTRARSATVVRVVDETADARSLVLGLDGPPPDCLPGQFVTLRIPSDSCGFVARCYSLSSSPHYGDDLTITVKRTVGGYASNWLCDNAREGLTLDLLPPAGRFTPASLDADLLLFAGGSGITPVLSILKSALTAGTGRVALVYANRDADSVIFAATLAALSAEHPERFTVVHWLESLQGIPSVEQLAALAEPYLGHEAFVCGPAPFMHAVAEALKAGGMHADRLHLEIYNSLAGDPFAEVAEPGESAADIQRIDAAIELEGAMHALSWPIDRTLVDVLLAAGIEAPYSCREGECGACTCLVQQGTVRMLRSDALDPDDVADGYALGCQALPVVGPLRIVF